MNKTIASHIASLEQFVADNKLGIFDRGEIQHGYYVTVTDGHTRTPVNFYQTGKILVQGKNSSLKELLIKWKSEREQGNLPNAISSTPGDRPDRHTKYLVIPSNIAKIRDDVVLRLDGEVTLRDPKGAAEMYQAEICKNRHRVTITQYESGTLLVQGRSSSLFDAVCDSLDQHLTQSFSERTARYLPDQFKDAKTNAYLEGDIAENEAADWLFARIDKEVWTFLHTNDQQTLLSAAGVHNAIEKTSQRLTDYSVVVMPFAKAYEGFLIRFAVHVGLADEELIKSQASSIAIGRWLAEFKTRLPDEKRFGEIYSALDDGWNSRNKAVHSDPAHPLSVLPFLKDAEREITTILRAMSRAYGVFVKEGVALRLLNTDDQPSERAKSTVEEPLKYEFRGVDRRILRARVEADGLQVSKQKGQEWCIRDSDALQVFAPSGQEGLVVIRGTEAAAFCATYRSLLERQSKPEDRELRIGVDESGKGDVFGPLVVAGVSLAREAEEGLARAGVRDSKTLRNHRIFDLAEFIYQQCDVEILLLRPPEYNEAYEQHDRNLNRLLAWCHAQVITRLSTQTGAILAVSDQFGEKALLEEALAAEGCNIRLEQRPRAEDDLAVAAASIVARAVFVDAINDYSEKAGFSIPLGSSDPRVKEVGKRVYRRWGVAGLKRIAKYHFKTVQEVVAEGTHE